MGNEIKMCCLLCSVETLLLWAAAVTELVGFEVSKQMRP